MFRAGHVVIDDLGQLVNVDRGFCDIMNADPASLIGRQVNDVTAPADREECAVAIASLMATRTPFRISKRFLRDDGRLIWVVNSVSLVEGRSGSDLIVATIDPINAVDEPRAPARLLDCARFLVTCRHGRGDVLDRGLITDTAWDIMLAAYVAEAEGGTITVAALTMMLDLPPARIARWIDILLARKAIEIETREADAYSAKVFRLTSDAHRRLETHLADIGDLQGSKRRSA